MVVGRKIPALFAKKHNGNESEFYADLLSHLLKNKLKLGQRQVINIAERGKTTRNHVLQLAMQKATERFAKKQDATEISFGHVRTLRWLLRFAPFPQVGQESIWLKLPPVAVAASDKCTIHH